MSSFTPTQQFVTIFVSLIPLNYIFVAENEFQSILCLVPWEEQLNGNGINYFPWSPKIEQIHGGNRKLGLPKQWLKNTVVIISRSGDRRGFILDWDQDSKEGCLG